MYSTDFIRQKILTFRITLSQYTYHEYILNILLACPLLLDTTHPVKDCQLSNFTVASIDILHLIRCSKCRIQLRKNMEFAPLNVSRSKTNVKRKWPNVEKKLVCTQFLRFTIITSWANAPHPFPYLTSAITFRRKPKGKIVGHNFWKLKFF